MYSIKIMCYPLREQKHIPKFPELSKSVRRLKTTERGLGAVCKVMKKYENVAKEEGRKEGAAEMVFALVRDEILSVQQGINLLHLESKDELEKRMNAAVFKLPATN